MRTSVMFALLVTTSCAALIAAPAAASALPSSQPDASTTLPPAPAGSATTAPSGPQAGQAGTSSNVLGEIIVTATRREESLQKVPIAVSAVTGEQLARTGISNTSDLTQTMPGLDFSRTELVMQPEIRGVGTQSVGAGDENSIAVYVDGVYQADPNSAQIDFVNIDRVEVLRGPQGTLFGRNATGGLINIITTPPSQNPSARFTASYGSFDTFEASAYGTTGITDTVAFDVSAFSHVDEGFIRDLVGGDNTGKRDSYLVRPRLLYKPTDRLTVTLAGSYSHIEDPSAIIRSPYNGNAAARALANDPNVVIASSPWTSAESEPQLATLNTYQISLDTKLDLGLVTLQNTASYQSTNVTRFVTDEDATPYDLGFVTNNGYGTHYNQDEFRILSNWKGPLSVVAGAYYISGVAFNKAIDIYSSNVSPPVTVHSLQTVDSVAGFGEATLRFGNGWKLVGGLRYTAESRGFSGETTGFGLVFSQVDTSASFDRLTYRGILEKELGRLGSVYASYSTGFKSGVFNSYNTAANSQAVKPEEIASTEVGLKLDPWPWLRVNISAFNYNYNDLQLTIRDPVTTLVDLENAASAHMRGGEVELTAQVAHGLNVRAFATLLDARFASFPEAQVFRPIYQDQSSIGGSAMTPVGNTTSTADEAGKRLVRAPVATVGGSVDYTKETNRGEFSATANVFYTAKYYWDPDNRISQPGYVKLNADLSWTPPSGKLRFSIWAKNLTNAVVYGDILEGVNGDDVSYEPPRSVGGTVAFKF